MRRNRFFIFLSVPLVSLFALLPAQDLPAQESNRGLKKFSASDICSFRVSGFFALRISGAARGPYIYINKMQYKLHANPTGGRSQFRLRIPDAIMIPPRFTSDINWWGDKRRDDWWNQHRWTTFWKRSYKQGKMSLRGADWRGRFRVDMSQHTDEECSFIIRT